MPTLLTVLAAVVVLLYTVAVIRTVLERLAAGREIARESTRFSVERPAARLRILVAGDSTAVGTGTADPRESVAGRLAAEVPDATLVNIGKNGARTNAVADSIEPLADQRFDCILLHTGANDILRWTPLKALRTDLQRLLRTARSMSDCLVVITGGNIGLAPLFPRPIAWAYTLRARAVRALFQEIIATEGAAFVDVYAERKDDVFTSDPPRYYAADFLHPSGDGYGVWYAKIRQTLVAKGFLGSSAR